MHIRNESHRVPARLAYRSTTSPWGGTETRRRKTSSKEKPPSRPLLLLFREGIRGAGLDIAYALLLHAFPLPKHSSALAGRRLRSWTRRYFVRLNSFFGNFQKFSLAPSWRTRPPLALVI